MAGKIQPRGTMYLRINVGDAEAEDGKRYEMTVGAGASNPIIRSEKSGRFWTIGWDELIDLAREAGIDEEDPDA